MICSSGMTTMRGSGISGAPWQTSRVRTPSSGAAAAWATWPTPLYSRLTTSTTGVSTRVDRFFPLPTHDEMSKSRMSRMFPSYLYCHLQLYTILKPCHMSHCIHISAILSLHISIFFLIFFSKEILGEGALRGVRGLGSTRQVNGAGS